MGAKKRPLHLDVLEESDGDELNRFVQSAPHGDTLQSFEWGEIKRKTGWEPIRLMVRTSDQKPLAAVTLLKRRLPLGGSFFYAPRGPVLDYDDESTLTFLIGKIEELASEHKAAFLKIDPDVPKPHPEAITNLKARRFRQARYRPHWGGVQPMAVCRLPLKGTEDEIFGAFHPKTRYNIRLAGRKGVRVRRAGREDLPAFFDILHETAQRQGFGIRALSHFEDLWDHFADRGHLTLILSEYGGDALAGALVAAFGNKAWYLYGGSRNRNREVMPAYPVQWEAIRWARAQGADLYDFLGVSCEMDPQHPLYGLYRFKRGFNPEYTEFIGEYDLPFFPGYYRLWNAAEPVYLRGMSRFGKLRRALSPKGG